MRFKLERAWRARRVLPGNVVCLDGRGVADPTRVVALDGWRTVVELDATGREQGRHELALPRDDGVGFLRTTLDGSGRRWWLAGRRGGQRVFVFDADWRLKAAYPGSGGAGPEGIGAAELADLDGDGTPEIILGHRGTGGVEAATLEGGTLWGDRSLGSVVGLAIGPPGEAVERTVLCVCTGGRLVAADAAASRPLTSLLPCRSPRSFPAPWPPTMRGRCSASRLVNPPSRSPSASIRPPLSTDWQLPLPEGPRRDGPLEPVCWADLLGTTRRQWLIAAADGSVTVAWADGRVVDRYQHGRPLTGIGGYRDGDTGHVVIATKDALEAYRLADIAPRLSRTVAGMRPSDPARPARPVPAARTFIPSAEAGRNNPHRPARPAPRPPGDPFPCAPSDPSSQPSSSPPFRRSWRSGTPLPKGRWRSRTTPR